MMWRHLAKDDTLFNKMKGLVVVPTYYAIVELSRTPSLKKIGEVPEVQAALKRMMYFREHLEVGTSIHHLLKLSGKDINHLIPPHPKNPLLELTQNIVDYEIDLSDEEISARFDVIRNKAREPFTAMADALNTIVDKTDPTARKNKYQNGPRLNEAKEILAYMFEYKRANPDYHIDDLDFEQAELWYKTFAQFWRHLNLDATRRAEANDMIDLLALANVQPGAKFWTEEKQWIDFITQAGCKSYLFHPSQINEQFAYLHQSTSFGVTESFKSYE